MTTKRSAFRTRGFSLVEALVYVGIMALLMFAIMGTLVSTSRLNRTHEGREATTRSAIVVLNRLNRAIKSADNVSVNAGVLEIDGTPMELSSFVETGVVLENVAFTLTQASTSVRVDAELSLNGINFYSTSVVRRMP